MFLYVVGAAVSFFVILHEIPGGWAHVYDVAAPLGKFQVFDFRLGAGFFTRTYSFWAGLIGGCFLTTASHGTEQLMVQRLLSRSRSKIRAGPRCSSSWVVIFVQFTLFLAIGVCLLRCTRIGTGRRRTSPIKSIRCSSGSICRWHCGLGDRGDPGCRDVQSERGAELARVDHRHGFLEAPVAARFARLRMTTTGSAVALDHGRVGGDPVRRRDVRPSMGQRAASRTCRSRRSFTDRCWASFCSDC